MAAPSGTGGTSTGAAGRRRRHVVDRGGGRTGGTLDRGSGRTGGTLDRGGAPPPAPSAGAGRGGGAIGRGRSGRGAGRALGRGRSGGGAGGSVGRSWSVRRAGGIARTGSRAARVGRTGSGRAAGSGRGTGSAAVLSDTRVLRGVGGRAAADALIERAVLVGSGHDLGVRAQDIGRGRSLDRGGHVEVRGRSQIHRGGKIEPQIDVGVDVEQRKHFLVRERDGALGLDLIH